MHVASFSTETCVYKVMGAPTVLGSYYPDLHDERAETAAVLGHNRYSTNTWPSFKRVQPFAMLGHNGEINTIAQLRQEARMLGVPIRAGRLRLAGPEPHGRVARSTAAALSLVGGDGAGAAADRQRDQAAARGAARLLHVPAPGVRPVRAGPGRADRRATATSASSRSTRSGLRPLWQIETARLLRRSPPSRASCRSRTWSASPSRSRRARRCWSASTARRASDACDQHVRCSGSACERWLERTGARSRRRLRAGDPDRRPARGPGDPRLHRAPARPSR